MVSFNIKLADKVIGIKVNYPETLEFCENYLTDLAEDFSVSVSLADIEKEALHSDEGRRQEGLKHLKYAPQYLETLALYRKIAEALSEYGVILFHGSALALDGEVYIFTAKSGTGKSTHAGLWREAFGERCVMVNDDKPLIGIKDGVVTVYGTPWNGKHKLGENMSAPLKAICILGRAEQNSICPVTKQRAFAEVFSQTYRSDSPVRMQNILKTVDNMLSLVPVYRLGCNMNIEAAHVAYNGMRGQKNEA